MHDEKVWKRMAGRSDDPLGSLALPRRTFLQLIGFSAAAVTLESCTAPQEKIVPYLNQPVEMTPGVAHWYASTCGGCSAACGVLVKVREGRPIKLEGNPEHPLSRGGLCPMAHAMVFDLFDAQRLRAPMLAGRESDWKTVDAQIRTKLAAARTAGTKVRVLTGSIVGPTLRKAIDGFLAAYADAKHVMYDAVSASAISEAHRRTHGEPLVPTYRFDRARVIVGFDADFLGSWIDPVQYTRAWAEARDVARRKDRMARHIQIESRMSLAGANADRRIVATPAESVAMIAAIAADVMKRAGSAGAPAAGASLPHTLAHEVGRIAAELWLHRGESVVVCGLNDPDAQQLVNIINEALGNYDRTVDLAAASRQRLGSDADVDELIRDMEAGTVGALIVAGANPSYDLGAADRFNRSLAKIPLTVSLNPRLDETGSRVKIICPQHHFLESWSDAAPAAGVASTMQPTLAPLFATRSAIETFLRWSGDARSAHQAVRDTWRTEYFPRQSKHATFEAFWESALHDGVFAESITPTARPFDASGASAAAAAIASRPAPNASSLTAVLYEKPGMRDGTHAGSPWLQEFPDPISRVSWDNYVCVSPELARKRSLEEGAIVAVAAGSLRLELPVHIQPGQHPSTVAIAVGYGRTSAGPTGSNVGANAYPLARGNGFRSYVVENVTLAPLGTSRSLATIQPHGSSEGRDLVRRTSLAALAAVGAHGASDRETGHDAPHVQTASAHGEASAAHGAGEHVVHEMWKSREYEGTKWGMAIDLNACTGCGACVLSCQAENNIPVVGRQEIMNQREMHWIRIDRYFDGDESNPTVGFQPIMCGQCDNATCENVCPVLATVHSADGLNMQVYNRCVGTRYCANNCAIKARRFNWFEYEHDDPIANLALNPDVTVRSRGVMEKCSFCVQRLQEGKIRARNEGRAIADGDVMTACQQSCPAQAISFGDLSDDTSRVRQQKSDPRNYVILEEINLRSALSYLSSVSSTEES